MVCEECEDLGDVRSDLHFLKHQLCALFKDRPWVSLCQCEPCIQQFARLKKTLSTKGGSKIEENEGFSQDEDFEADEHGYFKPSKIDAEGNSADRSQVDDTDEKISNAINQMLFVKKEPMDVGEYYDDLGSDEYHDDRYNEDGEQMLWDEEWGDRKGHDLYVSTPDYSYARSPQFLATGTARAGYSGLMSAKARMARKKFLDEYPMPRRRRRPKRPPPPGVKLRTRGSSQLWVRLHTFPDAEAAESYVREENWARRALTHTYEGRKSYLRCQYAARSCKVKCPSQRYLLYDALTPQVHMYWNEMEHNHETERVARGLPQEVKDYVLELYDAGVTKPGQVIEMIRRKGFPEPRKYQVQNYLNQVKNSLYGDMLF